MLYSLSTAIKDPKIKYNFLSNFGSTGILAPLHHAYRRKGQLLQLILSQLTDEHLFHALDVAMAEDVDGMGYVKGVLGRIASDDEKTNMLRRRNVDGVTMFARAAWTDEKKLTKLELLTVCHTDSFGVTASPLFWIYCCIFTVVPERRVEDRGRLQLLSDDALYAEERESSP